MERRLTGYAPLWDGEKMKQKEHEKRVHALRRWLIETLTPFAAGIVLSLLLKGRGQMNMDLVSGLVLGGAVSLFLQCFRLGPFLSAVRKDWEGTVIRRKEYRLPRRSYGGGNARTARSGKDPMDPKERFYTQYDIICRTEHGKRRLSFRDEPSLYAMLPVGARLRVSPSLGTFEKEDRSGDTRTQCPLCGSENGIYAVKCSRCGGELDG